MQHTQRIAGLCILMATTAIRANINIELRPVTPAVPVGAEVRIGLYFVSDDEELNQSFSASQVIIGWNPTFLRFLNPPHDNTGAVPLLSSGIFNDNGNVNEVLPPLDGNGMYTCLARLTQPPMPPNATPSGTLVTTLRFSALAPTCAGTTVSILVQGGTAPVRLTTVYSGTVPGLGVTGTLGQTTIVIDSIPPVIVGGSIAACYTSVAAAEAAARGATSATDNCTPTEQLTWLVQTTGSCNATISVRARDAAGNLSTQINYNTRVDTIAPTLTRGSIGTCFSSIAAAEAAALAATGATDNCTASGDLLRSAATVGDCAATVTVTVADQCGNSAVEAYQVSIDDGGTPPTIVPGTINQCYSNRAAAEAAALAATAATDNCTPQEQLIRNVSSAGDCNATITVTVADLCGNTAGAEYHTRIDSMPPVVTPGSIASCYPTRALAEAAAIAATSATDNCTAGDALTRTANTNGSCQATITITIADSCSNSAAVQYQTTIDGDGPTLVGGDLAPCFASTAEAEAAALAVTSASDNCTSTAQIGIAVSTVGTCGATVTITATDQCGLVSTLDYHTRIDAEPPTLIGGCPSNITVPVTQPGCLADLPVTLAYADNCDAAPEVTITRDDGREPMDAVGIGRTVFTSMAQDACGNVSDTCEFIIEVVLSADIDDDGDEDLVDVAAFVNVMLGSDTTPLHLARSDTNCDGLADGDDINGFVTVFLD